MSSVSSNMQRTGRTDIPLSVQSDLVEVPVLRKEGPAPSLFLHESALDTDDNPGELDSASVSSMEVASLRLPTDKMRRRTSETVARARPHIHTENSADYYHPQGTAIELAPIPSNSATTATPQNAVRHTAVTFEDRPDAIPMGRIGANEYDTEIGPSIPPSAAVSVRGSLRGEDDAQSDAPSLTPEQKRAFRRKRFLNFFAICYSFFLEGWNDGSTGPLLPAIQKHYNVRITRGTASRRVCLIVLVHARRLDLRSSRCCSCSTVLYVSLLELLLSEFTYNSTGIPQRRCHERLHDG